MLPLLPWEICPGTSSLLAAVPPLPPRVTVKAAVITKAPSFGPRLSVTAYKALTVKNGLLRAAEVHNVPVLIGTERKRNKINKIFKAFAL